MMYKYGSFMSFPDSQIEDLKKRVAKDDPVYTTRVSKDLKFKTGQIVDTPIADQPMKIVWMKTLNNVDQHPFKEHLTQQQLKQLKQYKKMRVLKLLRESIADNPIYNQTAGAGKNRVAIKDLVAYIKANKLKATDIKLDTIKGLDSKLDNVWGNGKYKQAPELTARELATNHLPRILKADTSYPIIYNRDNGTVLDGVHRAVKRLMQGNSDIKAYSIGRKDLQKVMNLNV